MLMQEEINQSRRDENFQFLNLYVLAPQVSYI